MATITLTAGDFAGFLQGYARVGSALGASFGSISAEPFAGFTVDSLVTGTTAGYDILSLVGNTTGTFSETSFTVNGNTWTIGSGTYNGSSATDYSLTTSGGEFANGVGYTIVTGGGGPANPNITSSASVTNRVNTTLSHTITADKTIASTAITGGTNAASFEINGTATLRFASNAASSALGPLVVDIEITDTDGLTDTQTITVTVKAIIFKGSKSYSRAGATTTATSSLTDFANPLTGATGIAAAIGDTVVVFPAIGSTADRDMIITTGYAEQADHYSNGTTYDANIGLFTKTLSSADTTVTFGSSGSANDAQAGILLLFEGVDSTTPMDVAVVLGNGTGTGKPDPASITPATAGAIGIFGGAQAAATAVALTSSDLTAFRQIIQADTNDIAVGAGFVEWTSGAIDPAVFGGGSSNAANSWATVSAVLRPSWTASGGQTLTPSLFSNSQTFYGPTITRGAVTLVPSLFTNAQTFYAPTIALTQTLAPSLLTNSQSFYAPTVTRGAVSLAPSLFTNTQTFYAETVSRGAVALSPSLLTNSQSFPAATVTASYTLAPALLTNAQTFYGPTVSPGAVTLAPTLLSNAQSFYAATVTQSAIVLSPSLVVNAQSFFSPTVAASNSVSPPLVSNAQGFYAPTVSSRKTLTPPLYANDNSFFPAAVSLANQVLRPDLFVNGASQPDRRMWRPFMGSFAA